MKEKINKLAKEIVFAFLNGKSHGLYFAYVCKRENLNLDECYALQNTYYEML